MLPALSAALLLATQPSGPSLAEMLTRAQHFIQQADLEGARRELADASKRYPDHPLVSNFLGVVEAEAGEYRKAEAHFRRAIERAPDLTDAYLNLGRLYQENARQDPAALTQALALYDALLAREPKHVEARYQSAAVLQARGELARCLAQLERLPAAARERPAALALALASHAGLGRHREAEEAADRLLARSDLAEADVLRILPALESRGDALTVRLLEGLRSRGLASLETLRSLGVVYERQGQLEHAGQVLHAAAATAPSAELLLDMARVAHKAGKHKEALGYLAHARDLAPTNAAVHFFFGMVCVQLELGVEAYNALKEAVRLRPQDPYFNYALGAVAMHRHDPGEAVPYFRRYAELRPQDPRGSLVVGIASFRAGDYETARRELSKAAPHRQTTAAAHYFLARIARQENDLARAMLLAQKAVESEAGFADAWAELGLLHFRNRNWSEAQRALLRCLELEPDNELGNLHLLMLYQRAKDPRQERQKLRVDELQQRRARRAEEFLRLIEVRPY